MRIQCRTLFDITVTGVRNNSHRNRIPFVDSAGQNINDLGDWNKSRNQQRNWETLNQLISLRMLPTDITDPEYDGTHWSFVFGVENPETVEQGSDPLGAIKADCEHVPMITGLGEKPGCGSTLQVGHNIDFILLDQ